MRVKQSVTWLRTALHALGSTAGGAMAISLMTMAPVQTVEAQSTPTCAVAWSSSAVYTAGNTASENGTNYVANWWTQGNDPATNSGGAGSGQPWTSQGACSGSGSSGGGSTGGGSSGGGTGGGGTATPPGTGASLLFSPYKDVTVNLNWNTNVMQTAAATGSAIPVVGSGSLKSNYVTDLSAITLAFATGECGSENWGGVPGATFASANISALSNASLPYVVSTGGEAGTFTCGSTAGFASFLSRYMSPQMVGVDFDIEGGQTQAQISALVAAAVYGQSLYPNLRFSFTLATLGASDGSYGGVNSLGDEVVKAIKASSLTNYTINLMVMDFGGPSSSVCVVSGSVCDMGQSAIQAAVNLEHTYGIPASKIELTPMIGVNDVSSENFSIANTDTVVNYAVANGLAGVHFWSLDRDTPCSQSTASPTCNSVSSTTPLEYTKRALTDLGR
ncbi:carbohydrate-binding protein [Dyella sp. 20L07]|uniref:carbohydrate-binding protein n=1 Tax=Dyella sp. 20L07 TaxID=3384240 RepID=UPI003D2710BC